MVYEVIPSVDLLLKYFSHLPSDNNFSMSFERGTVAADQYFEDQQARMAHVEAQEGGQLRDMARDRSNSDAMELARDRSNSDAAEQLYHQKGYHLNGIIRDYQFKGNPEPKSFFEGVENAVKGLVHAVSDGAHHGGSSMKAEPHTEHIFGDDH